MIISARVGREEYDRRTYKSCLFGQGLQKVPVQKVENDLILLTPPERRKGVFLREIRPVIFFDTGEALVRILSKLSHNVLHELITIEELEKEREREESEGKSDEKNNESEGKSEGKDEEGNGKVNNMTQVEVEIEVEIEVEKVIMGIVDTVIEEVEKEEEEDDDDDDDDEMYLDIGTFKPVVKKEQDENNQEHNTLQDIIPYPDYSDDSGSESSSGSSHRGSGKGREGSDKGSKGSGCVMNSIEWKEDENENWREELFEVPVSDLLTEFRNIFTVFYPDGIQLSDMEIDEACELFTVFIEKQNCSIKFKIVGTDTVEVLTIGFN